jgi:hypothetical protein
MCATGFNPGLATIVSQQLAVPAVEIQLYEFGPVSGALFVPTTALFKGCDQLITELSCESVIHNADVILF